MADLSQTASSVLISTGAAQRTAYAGETIAAGQPVALSGSTLYLADANNPSTAALRTCVGCAANSGSIGQPIIYAAEDPTFTHGLGSVLAGDVLYLSVAPGMITKTFADLASLTAYVTVLGVANSATVATLKPVASTGVKA